MGGALILAFLSGRAKGALPEPASLHPDVARMPEQSETDRAPFSFEFAGIRYDVEPVADYEMWGLVVTHNDVDSITDSYHDETSVDTKDLCLIFGENVATDAYRRVEFWSTAWTCHYRYPQGARMWPDALSNSHLITSSESIRERIADIRVGDEVRVRGSLVDYSAENSRFWRRSSQTRDDVGQGACEVIFVDELEILSRGTPLAYAGWRWSWRLVGLAVVASILLWVWGASSTLRDGFERVFRRGGERAR